MNLRLNNTSLVPPEPMDGFRNASGAEVTRRGHWWYYCHASDSWVFGGDYRALIENVREHLVTNRLPVPADLDGCVQDFICANTPRNWTNGCVEANPVPINYVTWSQMKRWFRTMLSYAKDRALVPQVEAEQRAAVCLQCRMMTTEADCKTGGCGGTLAGFLTQLAINRSMPMDDRLHACGVCGCALKAMCHFPNETLDRASAGLEYPSDTDGKLTPCWRLEKKA